LAKISETHLIWPHENPDQKHTRHQTMKWHRNGIPGTVLKLIFRIFPEYKKNVSIQLPVSCLKGLFVLVLTKGEEFLSHESVGLLLLFGHVRRDVAVAAAPVAFLAAVVILTAVAVVITTTAGGGGVSLVGVVTLLAIHLAAAGEKRSFLSFVRKLAVPPTKKAENFIMNVHSVHCTGTVSDWQYSLIVVSVPVRFI
jgi:hypothetical protein